MISGMKQPTFKQFNYSKYGLFLGSFGLFSCLLMFPSGISYGFFCGFVGLVCLFLGKREQGRLRGQKLGTVLCLMSLALSLLLFAGLWSYYTMLNDPVSGPRLTMLMLRLLEENHISVSDFAKLMEI